jgi:DNA-binding transcriptional MerR regulator
VTASAPANKPKTEATAETEHQADPHAEPQAHGDQGRPPASRRVEKSASAFRTISEVADELEVPQHVLRFWETKFPQVRPLKRGGGRRYYRPEDVELLRQIRSLLYHEGYTIKGVQRLMREGALKERVESLEGDTIDLSQLSEGERRRREVAIAIGQLNALRDRLLALLEP